MSSGGEKKWQAEAAPAAEEAAEKPAKHKKEEAEEPAYWGPSLNKDDFKYFASIGEQLEKDFDSRAERDACVANALEETAGKLYRLSVNGIVSRCIQSMVAFATVQQLKGVLEELQPMVAELVFHKNGSHVVESTLARLPGLLRAQQDDLLGEGDADFYADYVLAICKTLKKKWVHLIHHKSGTHIVRALFNMLGGALHLKKVKGVRNAIKYMPGQLSDATNAKLSKALKKIVKQFIKEDLQRIMHDQLGVFCLQAMLGALNAREGTRDLIPKLVGAMLGFSKADSVVQGETVEWKLPAATALQVNELVLHATTSHLFEKIILVAPSSLVAAFGKCLNGKFEFLAAHNIGNFSLQCYLKRLGRLLADKRMNLDEVTQMREMAAAHVDTLVHRTEDYMYGTNRAGVVQAMTQLAGKSKNKEKQQAVFDAITAALKKHEDEFPEAKGNMVKQLLSIPRRTTKEEYYKFSALGSGLIQDLLYYRAEVTNRLVCDFMALDQKFLLSMAVDGVGSRAVDGFLTAFKVSEFQKCKVIKHFYGELIELATHPNGSYTVENAFRNGDHNTRKKIAEELSNGMSRMLGSRTGKILLRKFRISEFQTSPKQWDNTLSNAKRGAKRKMAENAQTIGQDAPQVDFLVKPSKHKKHKKSKHN